MLAPPSVETNTALAIVHAVEQDDLERALELAVVAWRRTRSFELSRAIAALGRRVTIAPLPDDTDPSFDQAWGARALTRETRDVTVLIERIGVPRGRQFRERLGVLGAFEPDPRIGGMLLDLIVRPPFTGDQLRTFWRATFEALAKHADRSTLTSLRNANFGESIAGGGARAFFETLAADLGTSIERSCSRWDRPEDGGSTLASLLTTAVSAPIEKNEEMLRAEIAAAPDDDAPRLVYADYLAERGEPRGEFISLQILETQRTLTRSELARMRSLLKAHRDTWLEELAPIALKGHTTFRRGFPAHFASDYGAKPYLQKAALGTRVWATLESATVTWYTLDHVAHPVARNLRDIRETRSGEEVPLSRDLVLALANGDVPRALRRIHLPKADLELRGALERSERFPSLRELVLEAKEDVRWLWAAPLARHLEHVVFNGYPAAAREIGSMLRGCRAPEITVLLRACTAKLDLRSPRATLTLHEVYKPGTSIQTVEELIAGLEAPLALAVRVALRELAGT